ncbi:hypothetical protein GCG54_00010300 [Colletotrichum gloeosporioides]|uniref:BTB domain-containing protein n=1 Tax=Colletotrichum gloeosporioides TaxID=474922 RepID=A0A8H4CC00_COLGL|nr:uncharacterized protein GCG54_00010300 [Colletotrichum gloeosporioides]KAF3801022.1 hypothetical protein GCG54_00010300 [Colletotrichum gloeosporioides]
MADFIDLRPNAVNMAAVANGIATARIGNPVVDLHVDDYVHLHCGSKVFIVFRDIIVAGSMYFECCLFGFFNETRDQTIFFEDVDVEALEFYLNIAHGWFFEMKVRGVRVVPPRVFDDQINALMQDPWMESRLEIPQMKLATMAKTVILGDRFVHRPLLSILRHMFVSLLEVTQDCWNKLKNKTRDWEEVWHSEFMLDFIEAFDLLSTGHDDEKLFRDSLTETFYWFSRPVTGLIDYFGPILPSEFFQELHLERDEQDRMRKRQHAWGISTTDQMMYAAKTRQQKDRRFKRVVDLCCPKPCGEWLPWFHHPEEIRIRKIYLDDSAKARFPRPSAIRSGARSFVPGAATHGVSTSEPVAPKTLRQEAQSIGRDSHLGNNQRPNSRRNRKPRGGKGFRGSLRAAEASFSSPDNGYCGNAFEIGVPTEPQLSDTSTVIDEPLPASDASNIHNASENPIGNQSAWSHGQASHANLEADGISGKKKNKRRNKKKKQQYQGDSAEQDNNSQQVSQAYLQPPSGPQVSEKSALPSGHGTSGSGHLGRAEQNKRVNGKRGRGGAGLQHMSRREPAPSNEPQASAITGRNGNAAGLAEQVGTRGRGWGRRRGNGRGGPSNPGWNPIPMASDV